VYSYKSESSSCIYSCIICEIGGWLGGDWHSQFLWISTLSIYAVCGLTEKIRVFSTPPVFSLKLRHWVWYDGFKLYATSSRRRHVRLHLKPKRPMSTSCVTWYIYISSNGSRAMSRRLSDSPHPHKLIRGVCYIDVYNILKFCYVVSNPAVQRAISPRTPPPPRLCSSYTIRSRTGQSRAFFRVRLSDSVYIYNACTLYTRNAYTVEGFRRGGVSLQQSARPREPIDFSPEVP